MELMVYKLWQSRKNRRKGKATQKDWAFRKFKHHISTILLCAWEYYLLKQLCVFCLEMCAETHCSILLKMDTVFEKCHSVVNPVPFYKVGISSKYSGQAAGRHLILSAPKMVQCLSTVISPFLFCPRCTYDESLHPWFKSPVRGGYPLMLKVH